MDIRNTVPVITNDGVATTQLSLSDPMDVLVKMTSPTLAIDGDKVGQVGGRGRTKANTTPGSPSSQLAFPELLKNWVPKVLHG